MTAQRTIHSLLAFVTIMVLLIAGCVDDEHHPTNQGAAPEFNGDRFLSIITDFTEDDFADVASGEAPHYGTAILLGDGYYALVWHADLAEARALLARWGSDLEPDCSGAGIGFARCVEEHVEAVETCTVHRVGPAYHAHCEISLTDRRPPRRPVKRIPAPTVPTPA